jgi:lysozyme
MTDALILTIEDLTITKNSESCVLCAYPDPASPLARSLQRMGLWQGVLRSKLIPDDLLSLSGTPWTIGWGHTGPDVHHGLVWTQEQADAALLKDMQHAEENVRAEVKIPLAHEEFIALCDMDFNIGNSAFDTSTLLRKLNAGDIEGAIAEFAKWNHAGGQVLAGLVKRRGAEAALFALGAKHAATAVGE